MMDQPRNDFARLGDELAVLREQLQFLEANREESSGSRASSPRWRHPGRVTVVVAALVGLLAAGGLLYGQGGDAMFIDSSGRVGIGKMNPGEMLDVAGAIKGIGMLPPGAIAMFYGDLNASFDNEGMGRKQTPYEGWQLCNGNNQSPDLRDRFVVAAGSSYEMGATGGLPSVTLTVDQMPTHDHGGRVESRTTPTGTERPLTIDNVARKAGLVTATTPARGPAADFPAHDHAVSISINNQGGGQAHENRPPFFALAFIMRLPTSTSP
ncbi:MAG: hypothetical protein MUC41_02790 [Syntrophobacteraceae bacterium]|jgi:microcystin-dependent protein|nr:hypothetical protein [Syntrophobacteraceae bacterium]